MKTISDFKMARRRRKVTRRLKRLSKLSWKRRLRLRAKADLADMRRILSSLRR